MLSWVYIYSRKLQEFMIISRIKKIPDYSGTFIYVWIRFYYGRVSRFTGGRLALKAIYWFFKNKKKHLFLC